MLKNVQDSLRRLKAPLLVKGARRAGKPYTIYIKV
jgi:hypothetical protein